jgi:hypothetical protein
MITINKYKVVVVSIDTVFLPDLIEIINSAQKKKLTLATDPEARVKFAALPNFLRSGGSGTVCTQPREYNT